ncbi:MAG: LCP family protein [Acutalibacteraceae bacterium]|nr:LCP family protein [Oscillospiraceae bacterium]
MDDWFNMKNSDSDSERERKVGRIFQDDSYIPGAELMNGFAEKKHENTEKSADSLDIPDNNGYRNGDAVSRDYKAGYQSSAPERNRAESRENTGAYDEKYATGELDFSDIQRQIRAKESSKAEDQVKTEITGDIDSRSRKKKKSGGKSKAKKIILSLIAVILVVAIVFTGYAFKLFSAINYTPESHKANKYISESKLTYDDDIYNILLLGTDERATQANYRSDTMILVSLDKKNKKIKLTSFLRDLWVYIPAKDSSAKLNATCSYGGPQMVMDTLEYHFKVRIDKFVMINFDVFKTIINDLGGIALTITEAEAKNITKEAGFNCKPGTRTVKGRTALWYARIRHLDSDFNRTARQRKVIQAVIDKAKKSSVTTLMKVLSDVLPEIQTDMNKTEMAGLGVNALIKYMKYDIEEQQIPAKGTWRNAWVGSQQVLKADLDDNAKILKKFIYGKNK